jgi:ABC-type transport system substrate-binding protein
LLSPWPFGGAAGQENPGAFEVGSGERRAVTPFKTPSRDLKRQAGPAFVSPRDMRQHPIGTGPFKFVEFKPNQSIKLARNSD